MVVICPECGKKLNVPEHAAGKKARCPGCKAIVAVPARPVAAAAPTRPVAAAPQPRRETAPAAGSRAPPDGAVTAPAPASAMRCAACKAAALKKLPANLMTRNPGYVCTECQAVMRPPRSTVIYLFVIILTGFPILLGLFGVVITAFGKGGDFQSEGGLTLLILGVTVISWVVYQLRLPVPLDAPLRPLRLWRWVFVTLGLLLVLGGALFFFMYYLHEM